jgi:hypothetical protein
MGCVYVCAYVYLAHTGYMQAMMRVHTETQQHRAAQQRQALIYHKDING